MAPKFDWFFTYTKKYRISELKTKECKEFNTTTIASSYVGRDPQGGKHFSKFSFKLQSMVKDFLLVLEKKKKNKLQLS